MLKKLTSLFETKVINDSEALSVESACAVLLFEISKSDGLTCEIESEQIKKFLSDSFDKSVKDLDDVFKKSTEIQESATGYYPFVSLINEHYNYPKKVKLIETMWSVAYADGVIDAYEEHTIRKLADLLHIAHSDFIQAKLKVTDNG